MQFSDYLDEFVTDWQLTGRAASTAATYRRYLEQFDTFASSPTLLTAKEWLLTSASADTARGRARALRAFGAWAEHSDGPEWVWWRDVPLANTTHRPQPTVDERTYEQVSAACGSNRDQLVVELLWCTGLRVSELARLAHTDIDLAGGCAVVRQSKTGRPRLVPLSDRACRLIRRQTNDDGSLLGMSAHAIQLMVRRLGAPSAHAWRRGWAVHALRSGVSQTSVQAAAGWSSGAMVTRYTAAVSGELAISEFRCRQRPTAPDHPLT